MRLSDASRLANELAESMRPHCHRIEIAGSIRRRKPEVKDIELVLIPRWEERPNPDDLFGEPIRTNVLHADWPAAGHGVQWIKPATDEVIPWRIQPEGKYWRGILPCGTKLDLFLVNPENWGLHLLLRTGSAKFSEALVTYAKRVDFPVAHGYLWGRGKDRRRLDTPTEEAVFEILGLEFMPPEDRTGWESIRWLRRAA